LALAALVLGCQPLPHPFADDRPPAELLTVRDSAGVAVAPVEGTPAAVADKLGAAVVRALLKRDIPASDKTISLGSYQLRGGLVEAPPENGNATVTAYWRLLDAKGRLVGEHSTKLAAKTADWEAENSKPIERLAALSVDGVAPLIEEEAPKESKAPAPSDNDALRVRVAVRPLTGAPGDGGKALANAVKAVLRQQELAIVESGQKPDLTVDGEVDVSPARVDKQHVKILWRVRRADGAEIGTVGQENDVPKGLLDGPWGDLSYNIALAAGDGLMQLVARAAP
jgi:hypothetical protein